MLVPLVGFALYQHLLLCRVPSAAAAAASMENSPMKHHVSRPWIRLGSLQGANHNGADRVSIVTSSGERESRRSSGPKRASLHGDQTHADSCSNDIWTLFASKIYGHYDILPWTL